MAEIIPFDERDGALWLDGKIVPWRDGKVHVLTHAPHFASCVFEGERIYSGRIYKLNEHTERLVRIGCAPGHCDSVHRKIEINRACYEAAEVQGITDGYVRPVVFRGAATMPTVAAQHAGVHVAIAVWPWPSYFDPAEKLKGIRLDISEWRRPAPDTAPTKAKAAGLYMICTMSKHAAEAQGLFGCVDVRLSWPCCRSDGRQYLSSCAMGNCTRRCRTASSTGSRVVQ